MTVHINLRLPDSLHKELKEKAAQDNRSMHNLILFLLESCLPHFEPAKVQDERRKDVL
jgi:predicted HicB family RNase H-like nuclease